MIKQSLNNESIYKLKRQLSETIINNNYDLQSTEVLAVSIQLDHLIIPIFRKQFDSYYQTIPSLTTN